MKDDHRPGCHHLLRKGLQMVDLKQQRQSEFTSRHSDPKNGDKGDTDGRTQTAIVRETTAPLRWTWHHGTIATEAVSYGNHLSCQHIREAGLFSGQFPAIVPSHFSFAQEGHLVIARIHILWGILYQQVAAAEGREQLFSFL